jgi:NAD(P)-dependent dehydrogenase (short-subunit alcohol dehydrogenase family)
MQDAVQQALDRLGRVNILVANAGVGGGGRLQDVTDAHFRTVLDINLTGTANTIRAALPRMIAQEAGRIIVVTSIAGRMGSGGNADYAASKWGLAVSSS